MICESCGATISVATHAGGGLCARCLLDDVRPAALDAIWVRRRFPQLTDAVEMPGKAPESGSVTFAARDFESAARVLLHLVAATGDTDEFLRELEKRAQLDHPQIARILDYGRIDSFFYAIEALPDGEPLSSAIRGADVSRRDMLGLLPKISETVRQAAVHGVALPVRPETVYLGSDDRLTLTGIALGDGRDPEQAVSWIEEHPAVGIRVGNYELVEQIGEGGFAEVYRARQERPVRREVALKILKLGMDTRQVLARFAMERESLARMEHSGIARIFDAGATESGRPFIVMELVDGCPLTEYGDRECLSLAERAGLLAQVCRAVEHGNAKGVIHRDLKPSNVLVTEEDGRPAPKVIDFGIARAAEEPLTSNTFFTRTQQFVGSPSYMSPEQVNGKGEIDARSDVYSLGCVLYELLVGEQPLAEESLADKGLKEVIDHIQSAPVEHPADRFAGLNASRRKEVAAARATDERMLGRMLTARGLADIALKALSKKPSDRYASAEAMAEDLEAWVEHRTVIAPRRRRRAIHRLQRAALMLALLATVSCAAWYFNPLRRKPAISRAPDGAIRPVALFQFDSDLKSAIPDGPDMVAWGDPDLSYETARIGSEAAKVLHFPRFLPSQWLKFDNVIGVNGPVTATETNRWTLVYDVMFPSLTGPAALYQCHSENFGEAEMYVGPGGIGSRFGLFYGDIREGEWYRIAIVSSDNDRAQLYTIYVNGTRWGIPWVKGMHSAGYAFDDEILLFSEGDQQTAEGYVNSVAMYDVPLTDDEIRTLGAPTAGGIPSVFRAQPAAIPGNVLPAPDRIALTTAQRFDRFGSAVSMNASEAWVTATHAGLAGESVGAVYRYRQDETGRWQMAGRVSPPSGLNQGSRFGDSLALEESLAVVGAPRVHGGGAAFAYRREEAEWTNLPPLAPPSGTESVVFGNAVAIAAGNVFVGDPLSGGAGAVFGFDPETGRCLAVLKAQTAVAGAGFGETIAACGEILVVASPGSEDVGPGPIHVFDCSETGEWKRAAAIGAPAGVTHFGARLAVSPDGRWIAASCGEDAVRLYRRNPDGAWSEGWQASAEGASIAAAFSGEIRFASSSRLLLGAPALEWEGKRTGAALLFDWDGERWNWLRTIVPAVASQEGRFGATIAAIGGRAWIGAPEDHTDRDTGGAAFPLTLPVFETQRFETVMPSFTTGSAVAISGGLAAVGSPGMDQRAYGGELRTFALPPDGSAWREVPNPAPAGQDADNGSYHLVALHDERLVTMCGGQILAYAFEEGAWRDTGPKLPLRGAQSAIALQASQLLVAASEGTELFDLAGKGDLSPTLLDPARATMLAVGDGMALVRKGGNGIAILRKEAVGWNEASSLPMPPSGVLPPGAHFGHSGAVFSGIGVVGAPTYAGSGLADGTGRALVYDLSAPTDPAAVLRCPEPGKMPSFGWSVALGDGIALVGNPFVARGLEPGRVYLFRRDPADGAWNHDATLQASAAEPGDEFGVSLAIDGPWAIIGAKSNWVSLFRLD